MDKYTRLSEYLCLDSKLFSENGIHNGFIFSDSDYYVDPEKLSKCNIPEFENALNIIYDRINSVLTLLKNSEIEGDHDWNTAYNLFTFKEPKFVALGLGIGTIEGKGLSGEAARSCLRKMKKLVDKGYNNPEIIYAFGVFNDNVGMDKTSDLICNILEENILQYTNRILSDFGIECNDNYRLKNKFSKPKSVKVIFRDSKKQIPLALLPKEILSPIPRVLDKGDICFAIAENEYCKKYLSEILSVSISKFYDHLTKDELFEFCLKNNLIEAALEKMRNRDIADYDKSLEAKYEEMVNTYFVYGVDSVKSLTNKMSVYEISKSLLEHYKHIIENTYASSYNLTKAKEKDFQFLFLIILETVKKTLDISVNYEPKKSSGQVEFMVERGNDGCPIEFKLSSNDLVKGYEKQLVAYKKSGLHGKAFYVILQNNDYDLAKFYKNISIDSNREIIEIDCRRKEAPSKR